MDDQRYNSLAEQMLSQLVEEVEELTVKLTGIVLVEAEVNSHPNQK